MPSHFLLAFRTSGVFFSIFYLLYMVQNHLQLDINRGTLFDANEPNAPNKLNDFARSTGLAFSRSRAAARCRKCEWRK